MRNRDLSAESKVAGGDVSSTGKSDERYDAESVALDIPRLILGLEEIRFIPVSGAERAAIHQTVMPPISDNPRDEWRIADDTLSLSLHHVYLEMKTAMPIRVLGLEYLGRRGTVLNRQILAEPITLRPGDSIQAQLSIVLRYGPEEGE